jgi:hypothetical protein
MNPQATYLKALRLLEKQSVPDQSLGAVPEAWVERNPKTGRYKGPGRNEDYTEASMKTFRVLMEMDLRTVAKPPVKRERLYEPELETVEV